MMSELNKASQHYLELGFGLVPVKARSKAPIGNDWQKRPVTTQADLRRFQNTHNVGLHHEASKTLALDVDQSDHAKAALELIGISLDELLSAPDPKIVSKNSAKPLYQMPDNLEPVLKQLKFVNPDNRKQNVTVFELRAKGQDLLPPSVHPDGHSYTWQSEPQSRADIPELPTQLRTLLEHWSDLEPIMQEASPWYKPPQPKKHSKPKGFDGDSVITAFNEAFSVEQVLERNGYQKKQGRYLAPSSSTDIPGVSILDGRAYSHHASDPLADGHAHDAFGVMCLLEHGDNLKAALDAARAELGLEPFKPTAQNIAEGDDDDGGDAKKAKYSQAQLLLELAKTAVSELFHTPEGDAYAIVTIDNQRQVLEVKAKDFRSYLTRQFYMAYDKPPGQQAVKDALGVLEAKARYEGAEKPVHVRLAEHDGKVYLDLANDAWQVVEISKQGWQITNYAPVMFKRTKGLAALPEPKPGGSVDDLKNFVNVDESEWPLLLAYLVACLYPEGPYPLLVLIAEQGSGKSTQARIIKSLVDPNLAPLRSAPRDERDLLIAAQNSWTLAYDNLSNVPQYLSDALCRLSTGGGYATRELFSNSDETIIAAMRPVILTGIADLATRSDLLDRAVILNLPRLKSDNRRTERELNAAFEKARPSILGALLDAVVIGLRELPNTQVSDAPRMADFAQWASACEDGLGLEQDSIGNAYKLNRSLANDVALADSPLSRAVQSFAEALTKPWEGRASDLLSELQGMASDIEREHKRWPKGASSLSGKLRELAPNLRQTEAEIDISFNRTKQGSLIRISTKNAVTAVTASPTQEKARQGHDSKGDALGDALKTTPSPPKTPSPTPSPLKTPSGTQKGLLGDGGDAGDGVLQPYSNDLQSERNNSLANTNAPLKNTDDLLKPGEAVV